MFLNDGIYLQNGKRDGKYELHNKDFLKNK